MYIQAPNNLKLNSIIKGIESINEWAGKLISWLNVVLVVVICVDVVMRYFFNRSQAWITEFEWHLFALVFLIGASYTLKHNDHVRVDLFYAKMSERKRAIINIGGVLFFLIPWTLVVIRSANKYAYNAYRINEASPDPGGLSARWVIKYAMVVGFLLLLLQAVALLFRCIQVLLGHRETIFTSTATT